MPRPPSGRRSPREPAASSSWLTTSYSRSFPRSQLSIRLKLSVRAPASPPTVTGSVAGKSPDSSRPIA